MYGQKTQMHQAQMQQIQPQQGTATNMGTQMMGPLQQQQTPPQFQLTNQIHPVHSTVGAGLYLSGDDVNSTTDYGLPTGSDGSTGNATGKLN